MSRVIFITLVIVLPFLVGCSHTASNGLSESNQPQPEPKKYWTKQNYSQAEFNSDRYQCLQSAISQTQRQNVISTEPYGNMSDYIALANQGQLFSACMEAKGYIWQKITLPTHSDIMQAAYCVGVEQSRIKWLENNQKKYPIWRKFGDTENGKLQAYAAKIFDYLHAIGINSIPSDISDQIDKGRGEGGQTGETETSKCISSCNIDMTQNPTDRITLYYNCAKKCENYYTASEKRVASCYAGTP